MASMSFVLGCKSPIQQRLARYPDWQRGARSMVRNSAWEKSGLVKEPFPNLDDPLHKEIWMALWKKGMIGNGFGSICNYYGFRLVTVSEWPFQHYLSSFYNPTNHGVMPGDERMALNLYGGDHEATLTNAISVVRHLLALNGYEAFIVSDADEISHTAFQKENPDLSFKDWLSSKGILIRPPALVKKNEAADHTPYSEYTVFVYQPCEGWLFRYEIRTYQGRIFGTERFLMGKDIGDCWYQID
jgi:hypothetical protein